MRVLVGSGLFKETKWRLVRASPALSVTLTSTTWLTQILEFCFLLKHVEKHGREELGDKWSIRQMGVYACVGRQGRATFLVINPSHTFQQRLKDAQKDNTVPIGAADIFRLLISCSSTQWRMNINDIEEAFTHLVGVIS